MLLTCKWRIAFMATKNYLLVLLFQHLQKRNDILMCWMLLKCVKIEIEISIGYIFHKQMKFSVRRLVPLIFTLQNKLSACQIMKSLVMEHWISALLLPYLIIPIVICILINFVRVVTNVQHRIAIIIQTD